MHWDSPRAWMVEMLSPPATSAACASQRSQEHLYSAYLLPLHLPYTRARPARKSVQELKLRPCDFGVPFEQNCYLGLHGLCQQRSRTVTQNLA